MVWRWAEVEDGRSHIYKQSLAHALAHTHNTLNTHTLVHAYSHTHTQTLPHTQNMALVRINASLFQHNYNHVQLMNRPIIRLGNCTFWNHSFALWLAHETAVEGSQLAAEDCRFYGPVWRNEWRPGIVSLGFVGGLAVGYVVVPMDVW